MRDFSADDRWLSINTMTVRRQGGLADIVGACARAGIRAIAPWRDEVAACGVETAARLIRDAGLTLSGYCRGGMLVCDAARRQEMRDDNRRAVDEAKALGSPCLVMVVGGLPQYSRPPSAPSKDIGAARAMVADELALLAEYAADVGMPLALEPLHPVHAAERSCVTTLAQALDLCDRLDPDRSLGLGVTLDVYHVWWDPALETQIRRAGRDRLLAFHICDWLVPTTHPLNDRGMMGDGVIDVPRIRQWVEGTGYAGFAEVEIFSEHWWARPIDEVLNTCLERYRVAV